MYLQGRGITQGGRSIGSGKAAAKRGPVGVTLPTVCEAGTDEGQVSMGWAGMRVSGPTVETARVLEWCSVVQHLSQSWC